MSTKCINCGKELGLRDEDAGSDSEIFMRCDECLKILDDEIDACDRKFARNVLLGNILAIGAFILIVLFTLTILGGIFYMAFILKTK